MAIFDTQTTLDIRDIASGEVYYAVASKEMGGRCLNNGMFRAVWLAKAEAKRVANGDPDLSVIRCMKP